MLLFEAPDAPPQLQILLSLGAGEGTSGHCPQHPCHQYQGVTGHCKQEPWGHVREFGAMRVADPPAESLVLFLFG